MSGIQIENFTVIYTTVYACTYRFVFSESVGLLNIIFKTVNRSKEQCIKTKSSYLNKERVHGLTASELVNLYIYDRCSFFMKHNKNTL